MLNRRGLLALLGGAVAMPSVGVKTAASTLGLDAAIGVGSTDLGSPASPASASGWWGSPLQIAFDAKERASYRMERGQAYPHMKSWGHAFRQSAVERDEQIMLLYRRKMEDDQLFREKVLGVMGVTP
jgi:hypothetical protein